MTFGITDNMLKRVLHLKTQDTLDCCHPEFRSCCTFHGIACEVSKETAVPLPFFDTFEAASF